MTFETATVSIQQLCDVLANRMIGLGANWVDGDTGLTTSGANKGRVIKYNVSGQVLYVAFMCCGWGFSPNSSNYMYSGGLLCFISSGWDSAGHKPSGTVEIMPIPAYSGYAGTIYGDPLLQQVQYWLWFEDEMLVFGWQAASTANNDCVGMFAMEHNTAKEYADLGTNFFFYTTNQKSAYNFTGGSGNYGSFGGAFYNWSLTGWDTWKNQSAYVGRKYVHPFVASYPQSMLLDNVYMDRGDNFLDGQSYGGRSKLLTPGRARKSTGNSKVYMAFPVVYADATEAFQSPIATMKSFFPVEPGKGIADGDLINIPVVWEGAPAETWQYIYKSLVSPDGYQIDVAIKYAKV